MFKCFDKRYLPYYVLTLPLLIDTLNGFLRSFTDNQESLIGVLFKGVVIIYSILYTKSLKIRYIDLLLILASCCFCVQIYMGVFGVSSLVSFIKCIYCYFVLAILLRSQYCYEYRIIKAAVLYGSGAALIIILSFLFGWGYASYSHSGIGSRGFFIAMNDIGLSILLLNCLSLLYYQVTHKRFFLWSSMLMCVGNVLVTSMAGILGTALIVFFYTLSVFVFHFNNHKSHIKEKLFLLIILLLISSYVITFLIEIITSDPYLLTKYGDLWATFTEVSGRKPLIESAAVVLRERSFVYDIFGQGDYYLYGINYELGWGKGMKSAEVDIYDLVGSYGIIMAFTLIIYPVKMLFLSISSFCREKKIEYYWIACASLIFIAHSYYGGHAFTSPIAYTYFIPYMYIMIKCHKIQFK